MAVINGNGMKYRHDIPEKWETLDGPVETTRSVYEMWLANRVAFLVSVVNADPEYRIQLGKPNADVTGRWHISEGRTVKGLHEVGGTPTTPGELKDHVDGIPIQAYVYPRAAVIMAHLYVPRPDGLSEDELVDPDVVPGM